MTIVKEIDVLSLKQLENIEIIDVREADEFTRGHILGARNIPLAGILMNTDIFLDKEKKYFLICESGTRSSYVCSMLEKQGYHVVNISGGMIAYRLLEKKR